MLKHSSENISRPEALAECEKIWKECVHREQLHDVVPVHTILKNVRGIILMWIGDEATGDPENPTFASAEELLLFMENFDNEQIAEKLQPLADPIRKFEERKLTENSTIPSAGFSTQEKEYRLHYKNQREALQTLFAHEGARSLLRMVMEKTEETDPIAAVVTTMEIAKKYRNKIFELSEAVTQSFLEEHHRLNIRCLPPFHQVAKETIESLEELLGQLRNSQNAAEEKERLPEEAQENS